MARSLRARPFKVKTQAGSHTGFGQHSCVPVLLALALVVVLVLVLDLANCETIRRLCASKCQAANIFHAHMCADYFLHIIYEFFCLSAGATAHLAITSRSSRTGQTLLFDLLLAVSNYYQKYTFFSLSNFLFNKLNPSRRQRRSRNCQNKGPE